MLLALEQRTQEWYDWRNGLDLPDGKPRITATAASTIMGQSPFQTASQLWEEMVGLRPTKTVNAAMQAGIDFEDEARFALQDKLGIGFTPFCVQNDSYPQYGASLDGITEDLELVAEIKVPGQKTLEMASVGLVPSHYIDQMQWQMACTGPSARRTVFWAYDRFNKVGYDVMVERDDGRIELMLMCAARFRQCVVDRTPPGGFDLEMYATEVRQLMEKERDLQATIESKKLQLLVAFEETGLSEARTGGIVITKVAASAGSVSWKNVAAMLGQATPEQLEKCRGAPKAATVRIELADARAKKTGKPTNAAETSVL